MTLETAHIKSSLFSSILYALEQILPQKFYFLFPTGIRSYLWKAFATKDNSGGLFFIKQIAKEAFCFLTNLFQLLLIITE